MMADRLLFGRRPAPVNTIETGVNGSNNIPDQKIDTVNIQRVSGPSEFFNKIKSLLSDRYVEVMAAASTNVGAVIFVARTGALIVKAIDSWRDQKGTSSSRISVRSDVSEKANRQSNISGCNPGHAGNSSEKSEAIYRHDQQPSMQKKIIKKNSKNAQKGGNPDGKNVGPVKAQKRSAESLFQPGNAGTTGERTQISSQNAQLPEVQKQPTEQGATQVQEENNSEGKNASLREESEQLDRPSSQLGNAGNSDGKPEGSSQDEQRHVAQSPLSEESKLQIPEPQNGVGEEQVTYFNGLTDDQIGDFFQKYEKKKNPEEKSSSVNPQVEDKRSACKGHKA